MGSKYIDASCRFIAVVEDDVSLNNALGRLLKAAGFNVRLYETAGALLDDSDVGTTQCFVLDIHLPDMSAFELHDRLAAAGAIAPTVFITAHDEPHNRRLAMRRGAGYVAKPFENQSLLDAIARAVSVSNQ